MELMDIVNIILKNLILIKPICNYMQKYDKVASYFVLCKYNLLMSSFDGLDNPKLHCNNCID